MSETTSQKPIEQPGASPSCAGATGSVALALALAEGPPHKTAAWMDRAAPMCEHCRPHEDVNAAAARILAEEVRRVTRCWESDQAIFRGALQLLKEAGLAPGSTELIAAAERFGSQNTMMRDTPPPANQSHE